MRYDKQTFTDWELDAYGNVIREGTNLCAAHLQHMEEGISAAAEAASAMVNGMDIINKILDPEQYPLAEDEEENVGEGQSITVTLEPGYINRNDGNNLDDIGLRTPDFIPVQGGTNIYPTYEMVDAETRMCFHFYDSNYEFLTGWNEGNSYYYAASGVDVPCPEEAAYMRAAYYVTATEGTLTITTEPVPSQIVITLEVGKLSRDDGSNRDEGSGLRTPDFIPVQGGTSIYPVYEMVDTETNMCFLFYDSSYAFLKAWNEGHSYYYAVSGGEILCPAEAAYMKAYYSVTATEGTLTITAAPAAPENTVTRAEHKKIFIADHGYAIYGDVIDTDTMHKIVIEAEGKDGNTYNIVEVKAPTDNPEESTLCLMNWGGGKKQFVDFSSMVYDPENPTVEIVCQTRGGLQLPEFSVRFNDGSDAGRVKKFVVRPDAIPVELTAEGIRVRRNNSFSNFGDDAEFVTVNLADLYNRVLPAVSEADNGKILKVVNGVWSVVEDTQNG